MGCNGPIFPAQENNMRAVLVSFVAFVLLAPSLCVARDIALVVDKNNPSSTISNKELLKLLRNENAKWPDGRKVTVYLSNPSSADGKVLLQKIYRMTPDELKSLAESQKGTIVILPSDQLVLKAVANDPGAVGAVNVYSINSAIKVLRVDGKLPMEQGYLLHAN
jgi:ABC-type phosphate transport system substrate-binding protein